MSIKKLPVQILILFYFCLRFNIDAFGQSETLRYKLNPNYKQELGLYDVYKFKHADVVMLGDSRTKGCNWNALLGRNSILEMGIPSDIIEGYLSRINYVFRATPRIVFLEGGINDIYNWIDVEKIYQQYVSLIKQIQTKGIIVIVQSTMYAAINYPHSEGRNKEVEKLNKLLADYCLKNKIEFINLNDKMSTNGFLTKELTYDGVHLNSKGYRVWGNEVEKILSKYGY
jgi:lysophospholipase L1-like esterase